MKQGEGAQVSTQSSVTIRFKTFLDFSAFFLIFFDNFGSQKPPTAKVMAISIFLQESV